VTRLSLRRRLFILIAALTIAAVFGVQVIVMREAEKEISEEYNAKLISDAEILWNRIRQSGIVGAEIGETEVDLQALVAELPAEDQVKVLDYADTRAFRIWVNGKLINRSKNAPPDSTPPAELGFSDGVVEGSPWRIYTLQDPSHTLVFEVRENLEGRDRLRREMLLGALGPLIGLMTVLMAALFLSIDIGLSDLTRAVDAIESRSEDDLSPINTANVPSELAPVFTALNGLLEKLRRAIALERDFVDNAAHELRTPLTVLRLQAQLAQRATSADEQREAVGALESGIVRATTVVEQLLMLARFGTQDAPMERVNLHDLAQTAIAVNSTLPLSKHISLALDGDEDLTAETNGKLAAILLGVLLDNAFKYTPAAGSVSVHVVTGDIPRILIDDSGPGIPADKRDKVFDRFFRLAGAVTPGSGLGLAIAKQIAERLGIRIALVDNPAGQGLRVELSFPKAMPA